MATKWAIYYSKLGLFQTDFCLRAASDCLCHLVLQQFTIKEMRLARLCDTRSLSFVVHSSWLTVLWQYSANQSLFHDEELVVWLKHCLLLSEKDEIIPMITIRWSESLSVDSHWMMAVERRSQVEVHTKDCPHRPEFSFHLRPSVSVCGLECHVLWFLKLTRMVWCWLILHSPSETVANKLTNSNI